MSEEKKTEGQVLEEILLQKRQNAFKSFAEKNKEAAYKFCEEYIDI
ncbi:MAG: hypothetical protein Q4B42_05995 [Oscillospiraceae bacterium]|nr:hypothetical protein [Oscillospiraceae bacterium]